MAAILRDAGGLPCEEPHQDAVAIWRLFLDGKVPDAPILRAMAVCFAGLTVSDAQAFADRVYREHLAPLVYAETVPLCREFAARGLPLVVVSGSPSFLVEAGLRGLGIEAVVRGVTLAVVEDRFSAEVVPPLTWNQGKVEAIAPLVGPSGPLIALGDSPGDRELLLTSRFKVLVHPRAALQAVAAEHHSAGGWLLFRPERTASGERVQAPVQDAWG